MADTVPMEVVLVEHPELIQGHDDPSVKLSTDADENHEFWLVERTPDGNWRRVAKWSDVMEAYDAVFGTDQD